VLARVTEDQDALAGSCGTCGVRPREARARWGQLPRCELAPIDRPTRSEEGHRRRLPARRPERRHPRAVACRAEARAPKYVATVFSEALLKAHAVFFMQEHGDHVALRRRNYPQPGIAKVAGRAETGEVSGADAGRGRRRRSKCEARLRRWLPTAIKSQQRPPADASIPLIGREATVERTNPAPLRRPRTTRCFVGDRGSAAAIAEGLVAQYRPRMRAERSCRPPRILRADKGALLAGHGTRGARGAPEAVLVGAEGGAARLLLFTRRDPPTVIGRRLMI